jgi:hypothetical protein
MTDPDEDPVMFEPAAPGTDFRMTSLARMAQGGKWRVEAMRSYSRPFLLWFTRGQGRITVNGVTRGYGPHNAVFIPAGTMHGFDMVGNRPRSGDLLSARRRSGPAARRCTCACATRPSRPRSRRLSTRWSAS